MTDFEYELQRGTMGVSKSAVAVHRVTDPRVVNMHWIWSGSAFLVDGAHLKVTLCERHLRVRELIQQLGTPRRVTAVDLRKIS